MVTIISTIFMILLSLDKITRLILSQIFMSIINQTQCYFCIALCSLFAVLMTELPMFPIIDTINEWFTALGVKGERMIGAEVGHVRLRPPKHRTRRRYSNKWLRVYAVAILACSTEACARCVEEGGPFDTDSD